MQRRRGRAANGAAKLIVRRRCAHFANAAGVKPAKRETGRAALRLTKLTNAALDALQSAGVQPAKLHCARATRCKAVQTCGWATARRTKLTGTGGARNSAHAAKVQLAEVCGLRATRRHAKHPRLRAASHPRERHIGPCAAKLAEINLPRQTRASGHTAGSGLPHAGDIRCARNLPKTAQIAVCRALADAVVIRRAKSLHG